MQPTPWLELYPPNPNAKNHLICFPYAGSGAQIYRPWGKHLSAAVQVVGVQPPGRWNRLNETPHTRVQTMAQALIDETPGAWDGEFTLFGHSLGAIVAFEVARELRRRHLRRPKELIVSGRRGPAETLGVTPLHTLADEAFLAAMLQLYPGGIPPVILQERELLALLLPALRADMKMFETYEYAQEPPLECPIVAFAGIGDQRNPPQSMEAWQAETTGSLSTHTFKGGHFFILESQTDILNVLHSSIRPYSAGAAPSSP